MTAYSFTAPRLTDEELDRECAERTAEETQDILNDLYGQRDTNNNEKIHLCRPPDDGGGTDSANCDVSDALIADMESALEQIPLDQREAYNQAKETCPDIIKSESSAVRFLRCEEHDPTKAAWRLVQYWAMRQVVFEERAFLPMTLAHAMSGCYPFMMDTPNVFRLLPKLDQSGRTVIYTGDKSDWSSSRMPHRLTPLRILWYVIHIALQQESTQTRGVVILDVPPQTFNMHLFDRYLAKLLFSSLMDCLPIKLRAFHICFPSTMVWFLKPVVAALMSAHFRARIQVHSGATNKQELMEQLETFGLTREGVPTVLGGDFDEQKSWVRDRRILEESLASPYTRVILHTFYS